MLVSGVQQSDSYIHIYLHGIYIHIHTLHIHTYTYTYNAFFFIFFSIIGYYKIVNIMLYIRALLFFYFTYVVAVQSLSHT